MKLSRYLTLLITPLLASPLAALEFANINVVENDAGNNTTSVTVTIPVAPVLQSTADFFIRAGSNRGDYNMQIGASATDDPAAGIMLAAIAQNGSNAGPTFATPAVDVENGVGYFLPIHSAAAGAEWNVNVSAMWFPYADGWVGGRAFNNAGTNGGTNDRLLTSDGTLSNASGNHTASWGSFNSLGGGQFDLAITGADSRADGILFVNGGKNEDNYALSNATTNGNGTWRMVVKDNGADAAGLEQDPIAFAYMPLGTPGVTMGTVTGGSAADGAGALISQGDFTIQKTGTGTYQIQIAGQTPTSGTMLLSAIGPGGAPEDNIVTYQANGTGWVVQSRDLPGVGLQDVGNDPAFSFAFVPFNNAPTAPAALPTTPFNPNAVAAANFTVTEFNPNDVANSMFSRVTEGSRGMGTFLSNRGDVGVSFAGAPATTANGILFTSIRENLRDNSASGGLVDYGVHGSYNNGGNWTVSTERVNPANGEHNINFAAAYVPNAAGFQMAQNTAIPGGATTLTVPGSGDSRTSGLVMVTPFGNDDNYATVSALANGAGWNVQLRDNGSGAEADSYNHIYLPWGTENLTAGLISSTGYIQNREGDFSLTREANGVYRLSIDGKSASTGMLLLNAGNLTGVDQDNILSYSASGNDFLIHTIDAGQAFTAGSFQDTNFQFAYLDFAEPIANPAQRVFDTSLFVAGSFNVKQNDSGNSGTSVAVNPAFTSQGSYNVSSGNRGDFDLSLNGGRLNVANGILITNVAQNGRDNSAVGDAAGTRYAVSQVSTGGGGEYFVPVHDQTGAEHNTNISTAFFPYAGGWRGAVTGGNGTSLLSGNIALGSDLSVAGTGTYQVNIPGVNSTTDGIILATAAENEGIFTQVSLFGTGWQVQTRQTNAGAALIQRDVSLVYVPLSEVHQTIQVINPAWGLAAIGNAYGDGTVTQSGGNYALSVLGTGQYFLQLTGDGAKYPDLMTLLLAAGGGGTLNASNFLTHEAVPGGWLIETRNMGTLALHNVGSEHAFSFAVFGVVPEPSRAMLILLGTFGMLLRRRR